MGSFYPGGGYFGEYALDGTPPTFEPSPPVGSTLVRVGGIRSALGLDARQVLGMAIRTVTAPGIRFITVSGARGVSEP